MPLVKTTLGAGAAVCLVPILHPASDLTFADAPHVAPVLASLFLPFGVLANSAGRTSRRVVAAALTLLVGADVLGAAISSTSSTGAFISTIVVPVQLAIAYGARNFR
jgi:hypothetical protein